MAIGLHSRSFHDGDSPGLQARKAQLADALKDAEPAKEATTNVREALGTVNAAQGVTRAKRALERQQRYAQGQYPVPEGS